jgi:hypothetical protein
MSLLVSEAADAQARSSARRKIGSRAMRTADDPTLRMAAACGGRGGRRGRAYVIAHEMKANGEQ